MQSKRDPDKALESALPVRFVEVEISDAAATIGQATVASHN